MDQNVLEWLGMEGMKGERLVKKEDVLGRNIHGETKYKFCMFDHIRKKTTALR